MKEVQGVREMFREVQVMLGRDRERNGLVIREEKGQLVKRQERKEKEK